MPVCIMKPQKRKGGGANWMDTYGDMVTLLLCFFVLLYSISTMDENKWKALIQSFNPQAIAIMTDPQGNEGPLADPRPSTGATQDQLQPQDLEAMQEEINQAIEALYHALKTYADESPEAKSIEVTKGDGYVFVSFNEAVFFNPDSYVLRPDGEQVLIAVSDILSQAEPYIDEVRVMGHTAQAQTDVPNRTETDRMLASNRATIATVYIQDHSTLQPARLVSVGYGQHRPVAPNDTTEGRKQNRRVEILITGRNMFSELGDSLEQYQTVRTGGGTNPGSSGGISQPVPSVNVTDEP